VKLPDKEGTSITDEELKRIIDINLTATILCTRAVGSHFLARRSGKIINISSILGKTGAIHVGHYAAAKAGIIRFTDVLAKELGPFGIQVNAVCPGYVDTPALRESLTSLVAESGKTFEEIMAEMATKDIPLGRSEKPEDVANVVTFLCSEEANYMTGQAINITGGQEVH
jgi:NAD(P)-dependent dehydrogenase (short-subunit alcohol dehydrogenase family)